MDDRPNKCHSPDEPIKYHRPPRPSMDDGREAIKRAFNILNGYESIRRPLGDPSMPILNEPKGVTKVALMPP